MNFELDRFNGIIIGREFPDDAETFKTELAKIVSFAQTENKNIIWLTLPIHVSVFVPAATELGFVFHNCCEHELTLTLTSDSTTFIPFIPTHTLGAGAIVKNPKGQLLVIREHGMKGYKLPGGHIELGEKIETAIIREVSEETGIDATFQSILGFTTRHPFQFGKTNIYMICQLNPTSEAIQVMDTAEIAEAKWISISEYVNDEQNSSFNRQMIKALHSAEGLEVFKPENNSGTYKKHETFFVRARK